MNNYKINGESKAYTSTSESFLTRKHLICWSVQNLRSTRLQNNYLSMQQYRVYASNMKLLIWVKAVCTLCGWFPHCSDGVFSWYLLLVNPFQENSLDGLKFSVLGTEFRLKRKFTSVVNNLVWTKGRRCMWLKHIQYSFVHTLGIPFLPIYFPLSAYIYIYIYIK